ncbi:MAG TPA: hypothetical protein PLF26_14375 [Blastocatellia bacterium]|nr:hypothetical protein [Blastocatellia bacterium]
MMRSAVLAILTLAIVCGPVCAQNVADAPPTNVPQSPATTWSYSASASTYVLPDSSVYVQPVVTADHGRLHLEARYNYENLDTGSLWVGYNFSAGDKVTLDVTPMIGGVFGKTAGVAPGYEATLDWRRVELYSEGELVLATDSDSDSFFYNWSELSVRPFEGLRAGVVGQRTHAYRSERDIQRGFLVGLRYKQMEITGYLFDPDATRPTYVVTVAVDF